MPYKPDGYTSAAPYLSVRDAHRTIDFLKAVFGAEPLRIIPRPDGGVMHAEARLDDTVIMMGESPGMAAHVHVYVADVDAAYARALAAGATAIQPPERKAEDDDRRGGVLDADGNTWWIATQ